MWCIPGGKINDGETEFDCALRELREETGITPYPGNLFFHRAMENTSLPGVMLSIHALLVRGHNPPRVTLENNFQGYGWFTYEEIRSMWNIMSPADQLRDLLLGENE